MALMGCVLLLAAAPLAADAPPAASGVAPITDAQFARFMAVVPDHEKFDARPPAADPAQLEQLAMLNPGKEEVLSPILDEQAACRFRQKGTFTKRIMRQVLDALGAAKTERMIAFYGGPDLARLDALTAASEGHGTKAKKARAELARLMKLYPADEFGQTLMFKANEAATVTDFQVELAACDLSFQEAMAKAGLMVLFSTPQP